ncbi:uncharacterized protein LOC131239958 [Magnolia sinica]|uniref:uncharacterized protein LOC131239958 n=1 Tax=Magnolia sinica TaxID=86752 RepID=UPI00265A2984|nr:uncharacterized protein LOC131239958 [Magnolia sinica]
MRSVEDKGCSNYRPIQDTSSINACSFEFHNGNRTNKGSHHRQVLGSVSKPAPSKWDEAQRWVVDLSSGSDSSHEKNKPWDTNVDDRRLVGPIRTKGKDSCSSFDGGPKIINQDEGEMKKVDCNEAFCWVNKPLEDTLSAMRSVSVRDMGTEMTPIASQEPSRTGTPRRATTPAIRSPISSRSSTPERSHQQAQMLESYQMGLGSLESRSEAIPFGGVGSTGWSTREELDASNMIEKNGSEQARKHNSLETRAIAWDEAERTKYMARYKREEVKIQAWENHEERKAEMEMKRIEMKAERLKSRAQEKLANKLAATRRIAEERRANAASKLNEQAMRTSERADYIRRTGHLQSSFYFKMPSLCCSYHWTLW